MSKASFLVGGGKGGVGKSLMSMALLDFLQAGGQEPFLVETDTSVPDVFKTYQEEIAGELLTFTDLQDHLGPSVSVPGAGSGATLDGLGTVGPDESRAFEQLADKILGHAALQGAEEIEVLRVSEPGAPTALLVRSPEPFLWERAVVEIGVPAHQTVLPIPGPFKLTEVTFGATPAGESVTVLARTAGTLAHHQIDWRPLPDATNPDPAWTTYFEFADDDPAVPDGTQVKVLAVSLGDAPLRQPGTTQRFVADDPTGEAVHFVGPGVELRLVAPDETIVHQRPFFSAVLGRFDMRALRKQDGTAVLLFVSPDSTGLTPTALQLRWTFKGGVGDQDLRYRRGGSEAPEVAALELFLSPTS